MRGAGTRLRGDPVGSVELAFCGRTGSDSALLLDALEDGDEEAVGVGRAGSGRRCVGVWCETTMQPLRAGDSQNALADRGCF